MIIHGVYPSGTGVPWFLTRVLSYYLSKIGSHFRFHSTYSALRKSPPAGVAHSGFGFSFYAHLIMSWRIDVRKIEVNRLSLHKPMSDFLSHAH